jgi:thiol-disulfide isomerase/thioredoxin
LAEGPPAGIGVALDARDGQVLVKVVMPGTPAADGKQVRPDDRILAVAQGNEPPVPVGGMGLGDVVGLIRGRKGTTVRLTVVPAGADDGQARVVSFVRGELAALARWGQGEPLDKGTPAPDTPFTRLGGSGKVRLSDFRGRIVVLEFWASWCAPCQRTMAELQACAAANRPAWKDDVVLLTASIDENPEDAASRVEAMGWHRTQNLLAELDAIKAYHVNGVPLVYVIGRDGKVAASEHFLDVTKAVEPLLAPPPERPADDGDGGRRDGKGT